MQAQILQSILDNTAEGIIVIDPQGRLLLANPAAERIIGMPIVDLCNSKDPAKYYGIFKLDGTPYDYQELPLVRAIHGETIDDREILIRNPAHPDGLWISCNARPLRGEGGALLGGVIVYRDITRRRQAEAAVRTLNAELQQRALEHETRYRLAAKATNDAIWDWDVASGVVRWNEAIHGLFGYPLEEVEPRLAWARDRVHPEDRERVCNSLRDVIDSGRNTWSASYRFARRDGTYAYIMDRGYLVRGESGRLIRVVGALTDVSQLKQAEADLARSLSLLEATIESTADGLLVVDTTGRIVSYNRKFLEMWRIPEQLLATASDDAALQYALDEIKHPDAFLARVQELYSKPEEASFDEIELRDGRIFERYSQPQRMDGQCIGRVWSFRDVTERRRAENALQHEREFLRNLLENLAEGIVVCDADGVLRLFNHAAREFHMSPAEPIPAKDWAERYNIYHVDGKTLMQRDEVPLYRALQGEHVRNVEMMVIPPGGPARILLASGDALYAPDGRKLGAFVVTHDITERKRLERQLLQSQKLESIGTLAGGIAHDFNNLLAVILGHASVHLRDKSLPNKTRDSLADIVAAAERGSALTNQLLAYARGGLQTLAPTQLNTIVRSVLQMLRRTTPAQIDLQLQLAEDLPPITADPSQIEQVVMNLFLNAIQASRPPSVVEIRTAEQIVGPDWAANLELEPGHYACLHVQDHGSGMDERTLERIFEPFFTTKFTGRGMGLSAALGIVQSHHGQIRVESSPGKGTTVSVWLPVSRSPARAPDVSPRRPRPVAGSETILVIDPDEAVMRAVEQMLTSLGYCVIARSAAEAALEFLDSNGEDINLVLVDPDLPGVSAVELIKGVRQRCPQAAVLLASGTDDEKALRSLRRTVDAGFIRKPFSLLTLSLAVRRALEDLKTPVPAPVKRKRVRGR